MKNFLQVDDAVVAQKGHTAAKLNDLMSLYDNAITKKQYDTVKARVIAFRFGTYSTNTIREAFELFPIKDNAVIKNIKDDFINWLNQAENAEK
jgi:hypothetical protein